MNKLKFTHVNKKGLGMSIQIVIKRALTGVAAAGTDNSRPAEVISYVLVWRRKGN
jgi:hypothetical protein